ncbi:MAG: DUF3368 domain-containing protein, partial [Pyrinomonadaceae bacterium]
MIVVSDTSPISNLIRVGELDLLRKLFSHVIIPDAVFNEICRIDENKRVLLRLEWIETASVQNVSKRNELLAELDLGESEAIALALEIGAEWILIDEIVGRDIADKMGLRIIGIVGILLESKKRDLIKEIKPILE